ncbi:MAG: hypothetical protein Q7R79_00600 [bacterium]|nr:hypothetical protein [bacterium]
MGPTGWSNYDPFTNALLTAALINAMDNNRPVVYQQPPVYAQQQPYGQPLPVQQHNPWGGFLLFLGVGVLVVLGIGAYRAFNRSV